jgi:TatD DNase family protein
MTHVLIDTHCHLDAAEFAADRDAVYQRALAAGVTTQIIPAVTRANFADVEACCLRYPGCVPAWGMHPIYIDIHQDSHLADLRAQIEAWRPVAIGEIGLDLFVPDLDFATQEHFFIEQLKIARDFDLPVLLHCRRANDQIMKQLRRLKIGKGIAHAFSGSRQQADAYLKLGFKLGVGGAFTWTRASNLRALAKELPLDAIVLETDSPDMPPAWIGAPGKPGRNEPENVARIAACLAELRGDSVDQVIRQTSANAQAILNLSVPDAANTAFPAPRESLPASDGA